MQRSPDNSGTPIDTSAMHAMLARENLRGMNSTLALISAVKRAETYEALIQELSQRNPYGHFHLETTNVQSASSIMGDDCPPDVDTPKRYHLVVSSDAAGKTIRALEKLRREVAGRES